MREHVRAFAATPGRLLVVSDFDGTLAPIVLDPMGARIERGARAALRRLAGVSAARPNRLTLAVLSGRTARDVASRVRVGGIRYLGNHGLEQGMLPRGAPAERLAVIPVAGVVHDPGAARRVGVAVATRLGRPAWLFVEDKDPSVAFHFRQASDFAAARSGVLAALEEFGLPESLEAIEGRQVVEIRPRGAGGKGAALDRLLAAVRPAAVLAMGDDVSDAEAFRAIARARSGGAIDGLIIAVHGAAETPLEVVEAADLLVSAPRDAARVLGELARRLDGGSGAEGGPARAAAEGNR